MLIPKLYFWLNDGWPRPDVIFYNYPNILDFYWKLKPKSDWYFKMAKTSFSRVSWWLYYKKVDSGIEFDKIAVFFTLLLKQ